jgi:hypothetical protein
MMQTIYATARSGAAPQAVWELLAEVETWPRWAAFDSAELEQAGPTEPRGVGAVRRFRRGRYTTRERVTVFEPPRRLCYELLSGIPIRNYSAEVTLEPDLEGTLITWQSSFRGKFPIPASLVRRGLQAFIADTVEGLARAAEGA